MKIAVPLHQGQLSTHFGHCEQFAIVDVNDKDKTILSTETHTPPAHEPGVLPQWLSAMGVKQVIAGGMGMRAQQFFSQFGIDVLVGAPQNTPENLVTAYLNDTLECGSNVCDH